LYEYKKIHLIFDTLRVWCLISCNKAGTVDQRRDCSGRSQGEIEATRGTTWYDASSGTKCSGI